MRVWKDNIKEELDIRCGQGHGGDGMFQKDFLRLLLLW